MQDLETKFTSLYGPRGQAWVKALPQLLETLAQQHQLTDLNLHPNCEYHAVFTGKMQDTPIILKLGLDADTLHHETQALRAFKDFGTVTVLEAGHGFLILERADPGTSLKSLVPRMEGEAMTIFCTVMQRLHKARLPSPPIFPHVRQWLEALDQDVPIYAPVLQKARQLRDQLLKNPGPDVLLHGDLHHGNILKQGDSWVVIDPKGVIGPAIYEVGAFIRNPFPEVLSHKELPSLMTRRIQVLSKQLQVAPNLLKDWCFVQAVLAWVWALEDRQSPAPFQKMAAVYA